MFGQLGFGEILMIMVVILLLFGAKRIPEVAASFGKGIKEFKKNINDVTHEVATPPRTDSLRADSPRAAETQSAEEHPEPRRLIQ
ncbi:MAG TPA: twin-arginine translocase TatA/TatE family subunit [Gemmatimonadaceae bacterium]|jgi:sec-independent protein translocase protein TatA|nr:twin-arginine translocase TatA/TatE family subunit [Gemmatimonadaceae bacterium]